VTLAWFHCFAGIAGDMALGSLVDAGADVDEVRAMLGRLPLRGWAIEARPVQRGGIAATRMEVRTDEAGVVRTQAHIVGLIEEARLPDRVRDRALAAFTALAEVEGRLHRRHPSQVHFHEVGGLDAIVDIVGTSAALEVLEVDEVATSPVAVGLGMVRSAHGVLPNPAPAVVELLRGIPSHGRDLNIELTTPTGAALLRANATAFGPMPAMVVAATGFGAGAREIDGLPNLTQVVVGAPAAAGAPPGQPVALVETNVDDATGETLAYVVAALIEAGAHDAWVSPVVAKKGRPAHVVTALVDPALVAQVARVLRDETGTLGVRSSLMQRWPAERLDAEVEVDGVPVRVKVSPGRVKVEHDDAARAARRSGRPLREGVSLAEEAWRRRLADRDLAEGSPQGPEGEPPPAG
jgi:uncharacterized protein (TIGR00299 family) protein